MNLISRIKQSMEKAVENQTYTSVNVTIYFNDEIQEITINYNGTIENKIIKDL